ALVMGLSQCKKPNLPVLNIGETQHVVLNASWDNGGAKIDQNGTLFKWTIGDKLTVSGGATGELTCTDADNGIFEGTITKTTGAEITFTFGSKTYDETFFLNQTGALNDAVLLKSQELAYSADGNYGNVSMKMPHAVLKLNLSELGTAEGTDVTIKANGTEVASVSNVNKDPKNVYVAVPTEGSQEAKRYEFVSIVGGASCNGWKLEENTFYTLKNGDGAAIMIEQTLLPGKFSVSEAEYVQFSIGNLYCTRDTESGPFHFAFEKNQYDFRCRNGVTNDNAVIDGVTTKTPSSTAGLFLWDIHHAGDFGAFETSLQSGTRTPTDVFNWGDAFGSGSGWKTLTGDEWDYLRQHSMKPATVNGFDGLILRPDGYPAADVLSSYGPSTNPTWDEAEAAGLVFLPAAGYVNSAQVSSDNICAYWTANASSNDEARYYIYWSTMDWNLVGSMSRAQGAAVRLVQKFNK
ncbi:MAG: hypothetical protein MJZ78_05920, partial [Bacteroidales bacterium]|nr:hypothetical protein [Bacteroidales bacterium]